MDDSDHEVSKAHASTRTKRWRNYESTLGARIRHLRTQAVSGDRNERARDSMETSAPALSV